MAGNMSSRRHIVVFALLVLTLPFVTGRNGRIVQKVMSSLRGFWEDQSFSEENVLNHIRQARSDEERQRWIAVLGTTPVEEIPFYCRWLAIHDSDPFVCWTEKGYDEFACDLPREIQWLEATIYGVNDIHNGGLHQFFGNHTGTFAPEMAQWFDEAGLPEAARILRQAMAVFGPEFPRSPGKRQEILDAFPGAYDDDRAVWDPFDKMDGPFYYALTKIEFNDLFDATCDRWLRERCGIQRLSDRPPRIMRQRQSASKTPLQSPCDRGLLPNSCSSCHENCFVSRHT